MAGTLYLCATPIGNLEDITYRVVRVLGEVDLIAAEDTRNSIKLLNRFDLHTPMTSYHEYNKIEKGHALIEKLLEGQNIALITDAGMPGISDPGEDLVRMAYEAGVPVTVLPGACACVTALTLSGLPTRRFSFEAFLPTEKKERKAALEAIRTEQRTVVMYEAPHRLVRTLTELCETLGETRQISVLRELTKKHESRFFGTLAEAVAHYAEEEPKGECVLVLAGRPDEEIRAEQAEAWADLSLEEHVAKYEASGMDRKEAMKAVAKERGISKRDVYQELLK
ncbi:MAG: 16S rRNA (cytidine(1402)-2'-O)-methyltransferase [Lachnospiraceae bacterium]|nr:16S rRNA (cytidine(1402)-2'-O)-methyltransferase [Lachnospiraceae bacterium]